jgi:uncharacterized protein YbjT (DUF2867 family)
MRVVVTGARGKVGKATVAALIERATTCGRQTWRRPSSSAR